MMEHIKNLIYFKAVKDRKFSEHIYELSSKYKDESLKWHKDLIVINQLFADSFAFDKNSDKPF